MTPEEEVVPLKEERERLAQEYQNERIRMAEALKTSENSSLNTSLDKERKFLETLPETSVDEAEIPEEQSSVSSKSEESLEAKENVNITF